MQRAVLLAVGVCLVGGWTFYWIGLDGFLQAAYEERSWSYFNEFATRWQFRHPDASFEEFTQQAHLLLFRLGSLCTMLAALFVGALWYRPSLFTDFFSPKAPPHNLAIFRIAFFSTLLLFDVSAAHTYSQLPDLLQIPPPGLEALAPLFPTDSTTVSISVILFRFFCITGLLGLFSRTSAAVVAVLGFYLIGLPQLYGKVNHSHHLIWFGSILAVSRCGDALSIDALIRAWRHPTRHADPLPAKQAYALPLCYIWLLLGIIYFFPGFWKLANGGLEWALSENLKYRMHALWFSLDNWEPFIRLDRHPLLYKAAGLTTIGFEISFLFCVFFPQFRPLALMGGLSFHTMTRLIMHISFWSLASLLIALIDWKTLLEQIGRRLYAKPLHLIYDPRSITQKRVMACLRTIDLLGRVRYRSVSDASSFVSDAAFLALTSRCGSSSALWHQDQLNIRAYTRLASRLPLLWFLLPFAYGATAFRRARSRLVSTEVFSSFEPTFSTRGLTCVGVVLLTGNIICGLGHIDSWPFSVYPTFAVLVDDTTKTVLIEAEDAQGHRLDVFSGNRGRTPTGLSPERLRGLTRSILQTSDSQLHSARLQALWRVWNQHVPHLQKATRVRFYEATFSTAPSSRNEPPIERHLLFELSLTS